MGLAAGKTARAILQDPTKVFTAREEYVKAYRWFDALAATLIIGSGIVYATAVVIASAGTAGAVAMYGAGTAAAATGIGAESGLGLAIESGLARGLASEALSSAALPSVEREVGIRFTVEAARRLAETEADALLSRQLAALAQQQAERILARQAIPAAPGSRPEGTGRGRTGHRRAGDPDGAGIGRGRAARRSRNEQGRAPSVGSRLALPAEA